VTRLKCGGKYGMSLVANLRLSLKVKEFLKSANISQSYERISSGKFLSWCICSTIQLLQLWSKWSGVLSSGPFCLCGIFIQCIFKALPYERSYV